MSLTIKEDLPQIPQQNTIYAQSLCDQLRKTSEKGTAHSYRSKIFGNTRHSIRKQPQNDEKISMSLINYSQKLMPSENNSNNQLDMKIITFMREQIEICCQVYGQKMNTIIQDQARTIRTLGLKLLQNSKEIQKKNKVIQNITRANDKNPAVFQSFFKQLEQKQKQLNSYFQYIKQQQLQINQKCCEINMRLSDMTHKQKSTQVNSFSTITEAIEQLNERLDRLQKTIQLAQCQPLNNLRTSSTLPRQSLSQMHQNMCYLLSQMEHLKAQIGAFKKKKYCYQNYKVQELQNRYSKLENLVNKIPKDESIKSCKHIPYTLKSTQMTRTTSLFTHSQQLVLDKHHSQIDQPESPENSYIQSESDTDSRSEVQQMDVSQVSNNIQRFAAILDTMKICTPLKIQIDQTGYAKSVNSGMYLVDSTGDGFDFTQNQLDYLQSQNIIKVYKQKQQS